MLVKPLTPTERVRLPLGRVLVCRQSLPLRSRRSFTSFNYPQSAMFHRARDQYEQTKQRSSSGDSFSSHGSSPQSDTPIHMPVNKPFKRPSSIALTQTQPSDLNSLTTSKGGSRSNMKRTAEGSLKISEQSNPLSLGASSKGFLLSKPAYQHKPASTNNVYSRTDDLFGENDFDSDIELDIEESPAVLTRKVSYPKLPKQTPSTVKPTVGYPSLQQKADLHTQAASSHEQNHEAATLPSSVPLPWSSSPPEHHQTPPATNRFLEYGLGNQQTKTQNTQTIPPNSTSSSTQNTAAPKKRRTLPWLELDQQDVIDTKAGAEHRSKATHTTPKRPSETDFPWNATASAIKEQQKELRKANKEAASKEEGKEESNVVARSSTAQLAKKKTIARPHLSAEQKHVLDLVVDSGKSVFFTGSAGTGKSVLLREIIAHLRKKFAKETDRVAITASTGLAACNIGGVTLHSFAGFGLGKEEVPELIKKIKRNQKAKHRWMRTKVLIVDEVSMVDADMFDKLEAIARSIRNNGRPFGGIQLIITGDFFQLPPVPESGRASKFCFDASTWENAIDHTIALHHVFRQKDPVFASMLNEMREGRLSKESISAFQSLRRPLGESLIEPTELFPTRSEVDTANNAKMRQLQGSTKIFECRDGGTIQDVPMRSKLLQNCMAPEKLELKIGSQVMLIKNIDETLVNGTLGHVVRFMTESMFDTYDEDEEEYDAVEKAPYEELNTKQQKLKQQMMLSNNSQLLPLVRFRIADGTERELLCHRETWKIELPSGEVQAQRAQVPLILAWALSIHKAQGQTLERVKVDLGKVFEKGQAYVALSRAVSMNGLQVLRFDPNKVMAHERVRTFYASLSSAEQARGGD